MDLENLSQFNKRLFKKFLGIYVRERRQQLNLSIQQAAIFTGMTEKDVKLIESGQLKLTQEIFDRLRSSLELDSSELADLGKLTQVKHIMNVYKEIDEHYPR